MSQYGKRYEAMKDGTMDAWHQHVENLYALDDQQIEQAEAVRAMVNRDKESGPSLKGLLFGFVGTVAAVGIGYVAWQMAKMLFALLVGW